MAVKKLSIKEKAGKLVIYKTGSKDADPKVIGKVSLGGEDIGDVVGDVILEVTEEEILGTKPVPKKKMKIKAKNKQGAQVKAKVTIKEGEEEIVEEEVLEEIEVSTPMANVGFSIGRSINMGNYESLKIQVSINVPSEVDEDEIEGNYTYARGWAEQKLEALVKEYAE